MMKPGKKLCSNSEISYDGIAFKIEDLMKVKNPDSMWESCVKNFGFVKTDGIRNKFEAHNGYDLLENTLPKTENTFTVFTFKNGFAIQNRWVDNKDGDELYFILPACHDDFHRDWEHDGICIQDILVK